MKAPNDRSELRRFLGMANQMGKFTPNLAEKSKPLRELLSTENDWVWSATHQESFIDVKKELSSPSTLALYDPTRETTVSADASSYGLGAVLTQRDQKGHWRPVAYASRAMAPTEQRYAQIEKEALASTWACEKFADYIIGMQLTLETDHKPLVPLLGSKNLDQLPPRIQRFRMRFMRFTFKIIHVPGKDLTTADTLSHAPLVPGTPENLTRKEEEVNAFVSSVIRYLPATEDILQELRSHLQQDEVTSRIMTYCVEGWPDQIKLKNALKPYWAAKGEFTIIQGLLIKGVRLMIP